MNSFISFQRENFVRENDKMICVCLYFVIKIQYTVNAIYQKISDRMQKGKTKREQRCRAIHCHRIEHIFRIN